MARYCEDGEHLKLAGTSNPCSLQWNNEHGMSRVKGKLNMHHMIGFPRNVFATSRMSSDSREVKLLLHSFESFESFRADSPQT